MSESKTTKKKTNKVDCVVKRRYRFSDDGPTRKKGPARLSQSEYEFALMNNCLE